MAGFVGMDVEAVEGIGRQLKSKSGEIESLIQAIQGLVGQAEASWKGKDSTEFKNWWDSQHKPALLRLKEAIDGLGQSALNNATEQRSVSN